MSDQRVLFIGGVSLIKGRVKQAGLAMAEICEEFEPLLKEIQFVRNAPFKTISLIIRFGEETDLNPSYEAINKRHSELPVAILMELAELKTASKSVVKSAFISATVDVLFDVAKKYNLPADRLGELTV